MTAWYLRQPFSLGLAIFFKDNKLNINKSFPLLATLKNTKPLKESSIRSGFKISQFKNAFTAVESDL